MENGPTSKKVKCCKSPSPSLAIQGNPGQSMAIQGNPGQSRAVARSAKQIGDQTVLPNFWRKCRRIMQKGELACESRQIVAERPFFTVEATG